MTRFLAIIMFVSLLTMVIPDSHATLSCHDQVKVGAALAEIRGHIWAIEANIDPTIEPLFAHDVVNYIPNHGSHPIAEVYPELANTLDADSIESLRAELENLYEHARNPTSTSDLLAAVSSATSEVNKTQTSLLNDDPKLDAAVISFMVTLSADEYEEAIEDGQLLLTVELQDAYAFQNISQKLFEKISSRYDASITKEINNVFDEFDTIFDNRQDPAKSTALAVTLVNTLISNTMSSSDQQCDYFGDDGGDDEMRMMTDAEKEVALEHVVNIRSLLLEAKSVYNTDYDQSLELVKEAYLDHFEYIEDDIKNAGHKELNENLEHAIRDELTSAIRANDPNVPQMIDNILVDLDMVENIVPEFGTLALAVLVVTTTVAIIASARFGLFASLRQA